MLLYKLRIDAVAMDYPFRNGGVSVSESTLKDLRNRFRNWHHPIENILARSDLTSLSVTCALASPTTLWKGFLFSLAIHLRVIEHLLLILYDLINDNDGW